MAYLPVRAVEFFQNLRQAPHRIRIIRGKESQTYFTRANSRSYRPAKRE